MSSPSGNGQTIAIGLTRYGGPDVRHEMRLPLEPLGPSDIRISVSAAAVNPTDAVVRSGLRADGDEPEPPGVVPGMDTVGEVVEVGEQAGHRLSRGDRVVAVVMPAGRTARTGRISSSPATQRCVPRGQHRTQRPRPSR